MDKFKLPTVDVVCDMDKKRLPFKDSSVDAVIASHVLEHVRNFTHVMEEIWRVCKPGSPIYVWVPHFSGKEAFAADHCRFFNYTAFDYFTDIPKRMEASMKAKFAYVKRKIIFREWENRNLIRRFFANNGFVAWFANRHPYFYELSCFRNIFPADEVYFELKVEKRVQ